MLAGSSVWRRQSGLPAVKTFGSSHDRRRQSNWAFPTVSSSSESHVWFAYKTCSKIALPVLGKFRWRLREFALNLTRSPLDQGDLRHRPYLVNGTSQKNKQGGNKYVLASASKRRRYSGSPKVRWSAQRGSIKFEPLAATTAEAKKK